MDIDYIRQYCLAKPGTTEDFPFDETTLCLRVGGKIFVLTDIEDVPLRLNLKNTPEKIIDCRETHQAIIPGYHMNKKHWNTVILDGSLDLKLIHELIDDSYSIVYSSLPKKVRDEIQNLENRN